MGDLIDRRYLLIKKFIRIKEKHGFEYAKRQFTQSEHNDMFNYMVSCHTPDRIDIKTDKVTITPNLNKRNILL